MYFLYIVDKTSINYQSKTTMHFLTWVERFKQKWCTIVTLWRQWLYSHLAEEGEKNAVGWDKMLVNLPADCRGKSRAMMVLLHFSSSFCACRWNLCGHTRTPSCGSSAGHSRREAERRVSSPRGSPGGSESQAAVGPRPAASTVWRRPEGRSRGSLWHRIICPSVTVPAGREHSRLLRHCLCVQYIHVGFCSERVFVSQGLIFICCVSTRWRRSAEKLTREISACPFKETGLKRRLCLLQWHKLLQKKTLSYFTCSYFMNHKN